MFGIGFEALNLKFANWAVVLEGRDVLAAEDLVGILQSNGNNNNSSNDNGNNSSNSNNNSNSNNSNNNSNTGVG